MKLFLLKAIPPFASDYDMAQGFLIRAENETKARELACNKAGTEQELYINTEGHSHPLYDEGWALPSNASCEELTANGEQEILLRDFNAG